MFSTVTSWLGGTKPDYEVATDQAKPETVDKEDKGQETEKKEHDEKSDQSQSGSQMPNVNIGEVGEKTLNAAKEWGGMSINEVILCFSDRFN